MFPKNTKKYIHRRLHKQRLSQKGRLSEEPMEFGFITTPQPKVFANSTSKRKKIGLSKIDPTEVESVVLDRMSSVIKGRNNYDIDMICLDFSDI